MLFCPLDVLALSVRFPGVKNWKHLPAGQANVHHIIRKIIYLVNIMTVKMYFNTRQSQYTKIRNIKKMKKV